MTEIFKKPKSPISEYIIMSLGILLIAVGIHFFKFPNKFSMGGVAGISVVLEQIIKYIPVTYITITINLLMLVGGLIFIGKSFSIKTVYCCLLLSAYLALFEIIVPLKAPLTNQPVLEMCFAVIFSAVGSAMLFYLNASSGGTDIIAIIVNRYTGLRVANSLFAADIFIAVISAYFFGTQTALFSVLGLISKTFIVNKCIDSFNLSKDCFIITSESDKICKYIIEELHRDATVIDCIGAYTGAKKQIVISVLSSSQASMLKKYAKQIEPKSFVIVNKTSDVDGKGFTALNI